MAPATRSTFTTKRKASQVESPRKKRHCNTEDNECDTVQEHEPRTRCAIMEQQSSSNVTTKSTPITSKNAHLKGRKRFIADLHDLQHATTPLSFNGVRLSKINPGDEEGSVELVITVHLPMDQHQHHQHTTELALTLFIDATSSYPRDHSFFSFTPQSTDYLEPYLLQIIESVATLTPKPLERTVKSIMASVAASIQSNCFVPPDNDNDNDEACSEEEEEEEESDQDSAYEYEDYDARIQIQTVRPLALPQTHRTTTSISSSNRTQMFTLLRTHFTQIIHASYKPGFYTINPNNSPTDPDFEYALSVSYPVSLLNVPPRALVAWDRRLVSSSFNKNLVLVVSGLYGGYPVIDKKGFVIGGGGNNKIKFCVGLCGSYKPSKEGVLYAIRNFTGPEKQQQQQQQQQNLDVNVNLGLGVDDRMRFEKFSLSSSLENVLKEDFIPILQVRLRYGVGWAGAEVVWAKAKGMQIGVDNDLWRSCRNEIKAAELEDEELSKTYHLPFDPLSSSSTEHDLNFPLLAYSYLIRCFKLCTRYCQVCHTRTRTQTHSSTSGTKHTQAQAQAESLKPYICASPLCTYQFYTFNFGLPIEYEIMVNPSVVDLLVSLTYVSAFDQQLGSGSGSNSGSKSGSGSGLDGGLVEGFPVGLGMRVPVPKMAPSPPPVPQQSFVGGRKRGFDPATAIAKEVNGLEVGEDGFVEFDKLSIEFKRVAICEMLDCLPSIQRMKDYLTGPGSGSSSSSTGTGGTPQLKDMDPDIPRAAWLILRWCVASSTSFIEEIEDADEKVSNISKGYKQFRFSVGAPDKEARYRDALAKAQAKNDNDNLKKYPALYAFHGSPIRNWHSIIREGLLMKPPLHGRSYGHGVYFAQDARISLSSYCTSSQARWSKSTLCPSSVCAIAEIVNTPREFVSVSPYYVVQFVDWIMCRYLLVKCGKIGQLQEMNDHDQEQDDQPEEAPEKARYMTLDPLNKLTIGGDKIVRIPEHYEYKLDALLEMRRMECEGEGGESEEFCGDWGWDWEDEMILFGKFEEVEAEAEVIEVITDESEPERGDDIIDEWTHDETWVDPNPDPNPNPTSNSNYNNPLATGYQLLPPPSHSTPQALLALTKEFKMMMREQEMAFKSSRAGAVSELGWFLLNELMEDNLFRWMVELHSFDSSLPIAQDMAKHNIPSFLFEIRFPDCFPNQPPFFRVIKPRVLPFAQGGGGHITAGGSICMDLLTSDGWLPSYSISAVLLQIKLAISNLDPRPARLASNWQTPYSIGEALEGYKRAANTHGWRIPEGFEKMAR